MGPDGRFDYAKRVRVNLCSDFNAALEKYILIFKRQKTRIFLHSLTFCA